MAITNTTCVSHIGDETGVGEARRCALAMAAAAGLNETDTGRVAIAVTEAASNVLKHGSGGEILLRPVEYGVEMLAVDKGQGIGNLEEALRDGRSTAGTNGIGLGAIARLATLFDVYSTPQGTAVLAQFQSPAGRAAAHPAMEVGAAQSPYPGESDCGDAWASEGSSFFVADGLGHGFQAAQAAVAAVASFAENAKRTPREAIEAVHQALRSTRGAAVAVARIDVDSRVVRFCGLGNISGVIAGAGQTRGLMSHNGTAGHEVSRIVELEYPWPDGALLVLHSDGISAKWDLNSYPGLALRHSSLIAAVLYRDFRRQRDDATIVVVRVRPARVNGVRQ